MPAQPCERFSGSSVLSFGTQISSSSAATSVSVMESQRRQRRWHPPPRIHGWPRASRLRGQTTAPAKRAGRRAGGRSRSKFPSGGAAPVLPPPSPRPRGSVPVPLPDLIPPTGGRKRVAAAAPCCMVAASPRALGRLRGVPLTGRGEARGRRARLAACPRPLPGRGGGGESERGPSRSVRRGFERALLPPPRRGRGKRELWRAAEDDNLGREAVPRVGAARASGGSCPRCPVPGESGSEGGRDVPGRGGERGRAPGAARGEGEAEEEEEEKEEGEQDAAGALQPAAT